jgi:hypothetical protein
MTGGPLPNELCPIDKPWTEAQAGDVLTVTDRYEDLGLALRTRAEAAGFSYLDLDHVAGLAHGHCGKIFGRVPGQNFGAISLPALLRALNLKLAVIAGEPPIPPQPKNYRQDRHPLVSPNLPPRDDHPQPA